MAASERDARREAYVAKAAAELSALSERGVVMSGNAFSQVLLLKGDLAEGEGPGSLLGGPDGDALRSALVAIGYAPEDWCGLSSLSAGSSSSLAPGLLREAVATLDPATLVACDEAAARALRESYADELVAIKDFDQAMLSPGVVVMVLGMRVMSLGGFADSLDDPRAKQVMWARIKRLAPLGEPY